MHDVYATCARCSIRMNIFTSLTDSSVTRISINSYVKRKCPICGISEWVICIAPHDRTRIIESEPEPRYENDPHWEERKAIERDLPELLP